MTPRVDIRCPEETLEDSPKEDIMKVVATIMGNPDRSALIKETVQGEERGYQPLSDVAKSKIQRQENVVLIEMSEHSDKPECSHCLSCSPTGQMCCACGTLLYMEQAGLFAKSIY